MLAQQARRLCEGRSLHTVQPELEGLHGGAPCCYGDRQHPWGSGEHLPSMNTGHRVPKLSEERQERCHQEQLLCPGPQCLKAQAPSYSQPVITLLKGKLTPWWQEVWQQRETEADALGRQAEGDRWPWHRSPPKSTES